MIMEWYWWLLAAAIGVLIGWLTGLPYNKGTRDTSSLIINLILGAVGGLLGTLLYLLMRSLLLKPAFGIIIMSAVGAILLLWLLTRVKKTDAAKNKEIGK